MSDKTELQQEMGETAALSADDPRRQALQTRLAKESAATNHEWQSLLLENECLREHLSAVDVPDDLQRRLGVVPNEYPRRRLPVRWHWAIAAAAVVSLVLYLEVSRRRTSTVTERMQTVALLAVNNHLNHMEDHGVLAQANAKEELEQVLTNEVGFPVAVPELSSKLRLAGGRKCKLGTHAVAFTLWNDSAGDYSLFQFQPQRFGLSDTIHPTLVDMTQPAGRDHQCGAWIWTEGPHGYVLTGDPGNELQRLSPGSQSNR